MQERKEKQTLKQNLAQQLRGLSQKERNYFLRGDQRK